MKRTKIYQLILIIILTFNINFVKAQLLTNKIKNSHSDSLRGQYGAGRDWWDVTNYDVHVIFSISDSFISGYNDISFKVLKKGKYLQLDLQDPLILDSIIVYSNSLPSKKSVISPSLKMVMPTLLPPIYLIPFLLTVQIFIY